MSTFVIGTLAAIVMIVVIWFAFVAPAERRYHERKLELMRERIERRRQHLREQDEQRERDATDRAESTTDENPRRN